jgi:hypothetical protein
MARLRLSDVTVVGICAIRAGLEGGGQVVGRGDILVEKDSNCKEREQMDEGAID